MDYIKKALEKARKEGSSLQRESKEAENRSGPLANVWGASAESSNDRPILQGEQRDITPPQYSQTRKAELDEKKLLDKRLFSILDSNPVVDQYKLLRTMILQQTRPKHHNVIAITGYKDGEGKTLTAANLALTLAKESRQTVLLVDADLRRPALHEMLGINLRPGLRDYLEADADLKDLLVNPGIESLTVLPAGGRMSNSTEALGSYRMEQLVREIKTRYVDRYIILDTPALHACADALILSTYVDGIVLVVRAGYTTTDDVSKTLSLLKERNILGTVLNEGEVRREWTY